MNDAIKILLIEDSPSDADLLQEYIDDIDNLKINVIHVQLLGEAEIILAKENIDVVLLDLNLPDASGLDTVKRTYAVANDVPIVVLSGLVDEDMALEAVRQGAQDYLVKGQITSNLLIRTLRYSIERKQMERQLSLYTEELEARNRELDAYSYTIAHDLQNPIASLFIYTHMIRSAVKNVDDDKLLNRIDKLETIIEKMSSMINQLLHLARLRDPASDVTSVDMVKIARASIKRFEIQTADKNINIILDENLPSALGHPAWIEEVFANLIGNAVKYMDTDCSTRTITITSTQQDTVSRFIVEDTGPGIKQKDQAHLFEMFTRVDTRQTAGFGLGLTIVQRIITQLNGQVGVESTLGEGSRFWFTLPIDNAPVNDKQTTSDMLIS